MLIDPALFRDDAISDETRAFNDEIQEILLAEPPTSSLPPEKIRADRRAGRGPWGPVIHSEYATDLVIDGPAGDLRLRIIQVGEPAGVYLHIHGGGWMLGAADLSDLGNEAMAREAGVAVVSVDYRLAPEHPYPVGLEDCVTAATWLISCAKERFGTDALAIGGKSSGANLVAATLLTVRDTTGYSGWRGTNLVYGSYFPDGTPSVRSWTEDGLILDSDTMAWFAENYRGNDRPRMDDPGYSPLYGDLGNLPPALFTIGTRDPLVDDTLFMAMRWLAAGNDTDLAIYPGGIHAFDAFPIAIGLAARERMYEFVRDRIARPGR